MSQQEMQDQLERYLELLKQDEHNTSLLLEIGCLYIDLDHFDQAQQYIDKATAIDPKSCFMLQGYLHAKQGELDETITNFKQALSHNDDPEIRYNLAGAYYLKRDFESALEVLLPIKEAEHPASVQILMGRIYYQNGVFDEAIAILTQCISKAPNEAEALSLLSLIYLDNHNEELADQFSHRALKLDPTLYDARLVQVMLGLMTQETDINELKALLELNPNDSRLWFALGSTYLTQGELPSAIVQFQKTLEIHPEFYDCYIALAWCQLLTDQITEAHETYQNAISIDDDLADGWAGLAIIYALNEDLEQAEQLINKANSIDEDCFLTQIAQVFYLNYKNPEKAQKHLLETLSSQNCSASEKLAMVMAELTAAI